jgi:hypothetical protein
VFNRVTPQSDCDADNDVIFSHHYEGHTAEQGVADVLKAGTDVDCGSFVGKFAKTALGNNTITEASRRALSGWHGGPRSDPPRVLSAGRHRRAPEEALSGPPGAFKRP